MLVENNINSLLNSLIKEISKEVSERLMFVIEDFLLNKLSDSATKKILIDTEELAEQLSLSKSTIIKLRKEGLPIVKIGDSIRFNVDEVIEFIKTNY